MRKTAAGYDRMPHPTKIYEIVQLLRINGVDITRTADGRHRVRMGHKGSWKAKLMTDHELRQQFGPGSTAHQIMTKHQRAAEIIPAQRNKLESLA